MASMALTSRFNCSATCCAVSPWRSRSLDSSRPGPIGCCCVSATGGCSSPTFLRLEQFARLDGGRELRPQTLRVFVGLLEVAEPTLAPVAAPERLCAGGGDGELPLQERACLEVVAALVAQVRHLQQRVWLLCLARQRLAEIGLRLGRSTVRPGAPTGVRVRDFGCAVQRARGRLQEQLLAATLVALAAVEDRSVVQHFGIVSAELERLVVMRLCLAVVAELIVKKAGRHLRLARARILLERFFDAVAGGGQVALLQISHAELGIGLRSLRRLGWLATATVDAAGGRDDGEQANDE